MKIQNKEYDHIEIYDETGLMIGCVSDTEIIEFENCHVQFCKSEILGEEYLKKLKI